MINLPSQQIYEVPLKCLYLLLPSQCYRTSQFSIRVTSFACMMVLGVRLSKKRRKNFVLINFKQVFNMIRDLHKETGTEEFAYGLIYIEHYQSVKDKINVRTFEIKTKMAIILLPMDQSRVIDEYDYGLMF